MDLTDIFRTFHPNAEDYTCFSSAHETFSRMDHILGNKSNLINLRKIEIISNKIDLKIKNITRDKERYYIMIKGSIQEEDKTIVNMYAPQ